MAGAPSADAEPRRPKVAIGSAGATDAAAEPDAAEPDAPEPDAAEPDAPEPADETIPVELAGVTRFITRSQVRYAEAQGDYARLHTEAGSHLVRIPLTALQERWASAGFVRIHRSTLVSLAHIREVRTERGRVSVVLQDAELQVSRRQGRELRARLLGAAPPATS